MSPAAELILTLTLLGLTLSAGVMAGVYFAFSAFVITSLDKLAASSAAAAMNSINRIIVRSAFMPAFCVVRVGKCTILLLLYVITT